MPFGELKNLNLNKLLPMFPDRIVTHVPGLDHIIRNHSLTIFLLLTEIGWVALYIHMDSEAKWGQVVGNIVSEWTQLLGMVLLTKRLIEEKSKESRVR